MVHGLQQLDLAGIGAVSGAGPEVFMDEDAVAGRRNVDICVGRVGVAREQVIDIDAVCKQQAANLGAVGIAADGAEIEGAVAEPCKLNGDIDRVAADIGLAKWRAIAVDAIVADCGKSEGSHGDLLSCGVTAANAEAIAAVLVYRASMLNRPRACSNAASSAGGCASLRGAR
ncbi:hypothetical protein ACVMB3_001422 [Sinorhizobium meliloti]